MITANKTQPMRANEAAACLISLVQQDEGDVITHLKLQKLLYYAQAYSLSLLDQPLFSDDIKRWPHGPVVPAVYEEYKGAGSSPLALKDSVATTLASAQRLILHSVSTVYGRYEASALRNMTHRETPWMEVTDGAVIELRRIKHFFQGVLSGTLSTSPQRHRNALSVSYLMGKIDAFDVACALNMDVPSVIVMFEEAGIVRSFETTALDDAARERINVQLEAARSQRQTYNSREWVGREVIASQRIEDVDARLRIQELLANGT